MIAQERQAGERHAARAKAANTQVLRRWAWPCLLLLLIAPVLIVALTQDIGAHAFDAASEHIYRGVAFSDVINEGVLFPRWTQVLHWGLGSPLFTFQPPLPYYGMDLFYRLGIPHSIGWRFLIAGGFVLAFLGAYLLAKEITGRRWPAVLAAVAYTHAPYVVWNSLERGSNEAYSMFLYPLVLWSLIWLAKRPGALRFAVATGVWAACVGSHVLGPLMLAPFVGLLALFLAWRYRTAAPFLALLAGALVTAFIWLPMGPEQQWVHVERDFSKPEAIPLTNPLDLKELLAPPVLFDTMRGDNQSGLRAGLLPTLILLAGVSVGIIMWRRNRRAAAALLVAAGAGLFLLFILLPASNWVWQAGGSVLARLLYRMRLMGLQALAAACAAALIVGVAPKRWQPVLATALAIVFILLALPSLYVQNLAAYTDFQQPPNLSGVRTTEIRHGGTALTAFAEFTPRWRTALFDDALLGQLGPDFHAQDQPLANAAGEIRVASAKVRNQAWDLELQAGRPVTATLHLLYYPRWQAALDGEPVALAPQADSGFAQLALPAGSHRLSLRYGRTGVETAGLVVSGVTLLALVCAAVWAALRRRHQARPVEPAPSAPEAGAEIAPPAWLLTGLAALLVLKIGLIDPHTTLFRCVSTADRVCGADTTVTGPFVGAPTLRGYSVGSYQVQAGGRVPVTLYWQPEGKSTHPLASFVHIRTSAKDQQPNPAATNGMWAQDEHASWNGLLSSEFVPGKLYQDTYQLELPKEIPPGEYFLEVGWFDAATGEQADVLPDSLQPPLRVLWRSILLPNLTVTAPGQPS